jgi:tetratricopeptide (TPR) repeat protein
MDPEIKRLLHALYANPRDLAALEDVRGYLMKQKQFPALAKVLEWWSGKAPNRQQAAEALFDAADLLELGKGEPSQVIAILEKALEREPSFDLASIKLEAMYRAQGNEKKAAQLFAKRTHRISLIEALDGIYTPEKEKSAPHRAKPSNGSDGTAVYAHARTAAKSPIRSHGSDDPERSPREARHARRLEPADTQEASYSKRDFARPGNGEGRRNDLAALVPAEKATAAKPRGQYDSHKSRDSVADSNGEFHISSQLPPPPRVPEFAIQFARRQANAVDTYESSDPPGFGFEEKPTSSRRIPSVGLVYSTKVSGSYGGGLETQTVATSRSVRPLPEFIPENITQEVDADSLELTDADRSYQSYSEPVPGNGGAAVSEDDFDSSVTDETRLPIEQERELSRADESAPRADEVVKARNEAVESEVAYVEERVEYRLVASAPLANPAEIDTKKPAVEIDVIWGVDSVLHVDHLSPPRGYSVGDETDKKGRLTTDFLVGRETLGIDRLPILVESKGGLAVVVPQGAVGEVIVGEQRASFATLLANRLLQPCRELTGARQFLLPGNATALIAYRGFTFVVKAGLGVRQVGVISRPKFPWASQAYNLLAAGIAGLMLLCFALRPPETNLLSLDSLGADARLAKYLIEPPAVEDAKMPEWLQEDKKDEKDKTKKEEKETKRKPDQSTRTTYRRPSYSGEHNGERASRLLSALTSSDSGEGQTLQKVVSNLGSLRGSSSANSFSLAGALAGLNGLGGVSLGERGGSSEIGSAGGEFAAMGVGKLGGRGGGRGSVRGKVRALSLGSRVSGSLTQGQVLEVINRHMAKIQQCYERGLTRNPTLAGQVKYDWTVTPTGSVTSLRQASSTLGDIDVTTCIAGNIQRMQFPKPKGGAVTISFPFIFRRAQ